MGIIDLFRRQPAIRDPAALATFIDERAAFLVQKGIYEYSRARAGHYAKILFTESAFLTLVERSRWRAYPLGLTMVGELTEGILRPHAGDEQQAVLEALKAIVVSVFDRYPVPAVLGPSAWAEARDELVRQLELIALHPPKPAKDIPERYAQRYFALMPIHEKLRERDFPTICNYLKVTLCNIHEDLTRRLEVAPLLQSFRDGALRAPPERHA